MVYFKKYKIIKVTEEPQMLTQEQQDKYLGALLKKP